MKKALDIAGSRSLKGAMRREAIVHECMHVLATEGVVGLSYEVLAQRLKLSRAHVKYYFDSKEDLLQECFLQVAQIAQGLTIETLKDRNSWQERLHAIADGAFRWANENPQHMSILFIYYHYCTINPKLGQTQAQVRQEGRKRIEQILMAGAGKSLKPSVIANFALDLQLYLTGLIIEAATTGQIAHLKPFHHAATAYIDALIEKIESL